MCQDHLYNETHFQGKLHKLLQFILLIRQTEPVQSLKSSHRPLQLNFNSICFSSIDTVWDVWEMHKAIISEAWKLWVFFGRGYFSRDDIYLEICFNTTRLTMMHSLLKQLGLFLLLPTCRRKSFFWQKDQWPSKQIIVMPNLPTWKKIKNLQSAVSSSENRIEGAAVFLSTYTIVSLSPSPLILLFQKIREG